MENRQSGAGSDAPSHQKGHAEALQHIAGVISDAKSAVSAVIDSAGGAEAACRAAAEDTLQVHNVCECA